MPTPHFPCPHCHRAIHFSDRDVAPPPPPPEPMVTRIVRGPGAYRGKRAGERVEIPVSWIGKDPTVEANTMTVEEWEKRAEAEAVLRPKGAAAMARAKAPPADAFDQDMFGDPSLDVALL